MIGKQLRGHNPASKFLKNKSFVQAKEHRQLENNFAERDLGVLVNEMTTSQHYALAAKMASDILVLHSEEHCQQAKGGDPPPLLSTGKTHLGCRLHF